MATQSHGQPHGTIVSCFNPQVNHAHLMPFQEVQALMISYTQMTNNQGNLSHLILTERILSPHTTLNSCRTTHGNLSHLMSSERISSPLGTLISCLTMLVISSMKSRRFRTTFLSFFLSSQENVPTATSAQKKKQMIFPTTLLPLFQVMFPSPISLASEGNSPRTSATSTCQKPTVLGIFGRCFP